MGNFKMLSASSFRRDLNFRRFKLLPTCAFSVLLFLGLLVFFLPFRNLVLRPVFPEVWRDIRTHDIIRMRFFNYREPEDFGVHLVCENLMKLDDISNRNKEILDPGKIIHNNNVSVAQTREMLSRGLGRFLPYLNIDQKMRALRLYVALQTVLEKNKIPFFLASGTLFGGARHGGFIPWDDDMDIAIDVEHKRATRKALSCVVGAKVEISAIFHWKFHLEGHDFPFIDIFLYDKDDRFLWALTPYITRVILYRLSNVFPLTTMVFEGSITAPVPGNYMTTLHRVYRFSQCIAHKSHGGVKRSWLSEFPDGYAKTNILCSTLLDFYKIHHLED